MNAITKVIRFLVRVDLQNCFGSKGTLPVPNGDEVVEPANKLSRSGRYNYVVDSQDWHPADHGSFAANNPGKSPFEDGMLSGLNQKFWTVHGVQNTADADFLPGLDRTVVAFTVRKGMDKRVDSYSAFYDNGKSASAELKAQYPFLGTSTGLAEWMVQKAIEAGAEAIEVDVIGLATDYCVKFTALDAAAETYKGSPFKVRVVIDACRGLGPVEPVIAELKAAGIEVVNSDAVLPAAAGK